MLRQRPRREGEIKQSQHDDVVPLDSDEQAKVVAALEEEAKRQTTVFNRVFSILLVVCGLALVRCSLELLFREDSQPLAHRVAIAEVPSWAFQLTYAGHLLELYLCHKVAQGHRWHVAPAVCIVWTSMISWFVVFTRFKVTNLLLFWLPLGPTFLLSLAVYLQTSAERLNRDVQQLEGLKYNHKQL